MSSATQEVLGLLGFALVFGLMALLLLRRSDDLPPGYGTPGDGRKDRKAWAFISLFGAACCVALAIMSVVVE